MNDHTFPETSDFRRESTGDEVMFSFSCKLRNDWELFETPPGILGMSSDMIGFSTKIPGTLRTKIARI